VTQLLGLLFRSAAHKLKPLEAVLVYQHFFVLKCLMENVTRVQDYIQEQYEEEFRLVTRKAEIQNRIMPSKSYLIPTGWTTKRNNVQVHFRRRLVSKSGSMFNKFQVQ
jgi:hypothetical protein